MSEALPRRRRPEAKPRSLDNDDARSAEIRAIVLQLVAEQGYDGVTIDEIAYAARASKATLYRRWSSKEALVVDAVRENVALLEDPGDTGALRGDLLAILRVVAGELARDADLVIALMAAARRNEELMEIISAQLRKPGEAVGRLPLERAIARGELAGDTDTLLIAEIAMPMLLHRAIWREPIDGAVVEHVVDDVLLPLLRVRGPMSSEGAAAEGDTALPAL